MDGIPLVEYSIILGMFLHDDVRKQLLEGNGRVIFVDEMFPQEVFQSFLAKFLRIFDFLVLGHDSSLYHLIKNSQGKKKLLKQNNLKIVGLFNKQREKLQQRKITLSIDFSFDFDHRTYLSKSKPISLKVVINKVTKSLCQQAYMPSNIPQRIIIQMIEQLVSELESNICNLTRKDIGEVEIQLICSKNVSHIQTLRLSYNSIGPAPMIHFQNTRWLSLKKLYLTETLIGDKGCKSLSRTGLDELKELYISRNLITNAGAMHLSKGKWKQLECIDTSYNKMGNSSVKTLIKGDWKELQILWMNCMKLGFGEIMHYFTSQFAKLSCIYIDDFDLIGEKVEWFNSLINMKCPEIMDCFRLQF